MKQRILFVFISLLPITNCYAQSSAFQWGTICNNGQSFGYGFGDSWSAAVDTKKNVLLTGYFTNYLNGGKFKLSTGINGDAYFIKCDSAGNFIWGQQTNTDNFAYGTGVASDGAGNSYFTGWFEGDITIGSNKFSDAYNCFPSMYVCKFDVNGNLSWAKEVTGYDSVYLNQIESENMAADNYGNVYVTGYYVGPVAFDAIKANNNYDNFFTVKYDTYGNVIWVDTTKYLSHYDGYSFSTNITVDNYKNVYVTGVYLDTLCVGSDTLIAPFLYTPNIFIIKYDSTGKVLWAQQPYTDDVIGYDSIIPYYPVITDKSGNVYLSGSYQQSITFGNVSITSPPGQNNNVFLVKMDTSGKALWGKTTLSQNGTYWQGYFLSADTTPRIYLSCGNWYSDFYFYNPGDDSIQFGSHIMVSPDSGDGVSAIWQLDTSGNVLCSAVFRGAADDNNFIVTDPQGKYVYFGGDLWASAQMGPDSLIPADEQPLAARWNVCSCNLSVTTNTPSALCAGQIDTLKASGGTTYSWSPSTGLSATTGSSVLASPTVTTTYEVVISAGNCVDTAQEVVIVNAIINQPTFFQHGDTLTSSSVQDNQWYRNGYLLENDTSQNLIINTTGWYYVAVLNEANGCSTASDSMDITSLTGIEQLTVESGQLTVYPNPTSNQLTVESGEMIMNEIIITNLLGQTELRSPLGDLGVTKQTINVSNFPNGMYFITVINNAERVVVPVVKE